MRDIKKKIDFIAPFFILGWNTNRKKKIDFCNTKHSEHTYRFLSLVVFGRRSQLIRFVFLLYFWNLEKCWTLIWNTLLWNISYHFVHTHTAIWMIEMIILVSLFCLLLLFWFYSLCAINSMNSIDSSEIFYT